MNFDLTQLFAQLPIAGAMIWFAYYIVSDSRKERKAFLEDAKAERETWADERKDMYNKISVSQNSLSETIKTQGEYIKQNTKTLESLLTSKCYKDR